jgi:hypothetical protein
MEIEIKTVQLRQQTPTDGYLLKVSDECYVLGATLAKDQEPFEEVSIELVPEELRPGYVAPAIKE